MREPKRKGREMRDKDKRDGCRSGLCRTPTGFFRRELPEAHWWHQALMPLGFAAVGATVGTAFVILCVHEFLVVLTCLLMPIGVFVLLGLCSFGGVVTALRWWWEAWREYRRVWEHRDMRLERTLKRSLAKTESQNMAGAGQPRIAPGRPYGSSDFDRILGGIPQPLPSRWKRLDPAALPPYPLLGDCCHRPLQRVHAK
jgi:hypothetical protein